MEIGLWFYMDLDKIICRNYQDLSDPMPINSAKIAAGHIEISGINPRFLL